MAMCDKTVQLVLHTLGNKVHDAVISQLTDSMIDTISEFSSRKHANCQLFVEKQNTCTKKWDKPTEQDDDGLSTDQNTLYKCWLI